MSGYTQCRCRDCFEIAVSDDDDSPDFCGACEEAGCEDDSECLARCEYCYSSDHETDECDADARCERCGGADHDESEHTPC